MRLRFQVVFILGLPLMAMGQRDVPELANHRVHDDVGVLSQGAVQFLESSLRQFEDSTSNQIAILIVPSLEGETIDQFGIRVAEKWKLGVADRDNGVIVLVAMQEHKMRIEVGQGLEGPLPDVICNRIIRNEMAPAFRREAYDEGMIEAVDAIRKAIKGEYRGSGHRSKGPKLPIGFIVLIIIVIIAMRSRRGGGRGGGWSSRGGWFLAGALMGGRGGGGGGGFGGFSGGGGSFGGGGSSGSW